MSCRIARIAESQFTRRALHHRNNTIGDIVLHAEQPQSGTTLAGRTEGRGHNVVGHLFGQSRGIDNHCIDATSLGNQHRYRSVL